MMRIDQRIDGQGSDVTHQHREAVGLGARHHLAFELATLDEVFRARDHLKQSGVTITFNGRRRAGCQVAVEFLDPDGHHLELYWGVDQIGYDGRARPAEEWRQTASLEDAVRIAPPGQDTTLHDAALRARLEAGTDRP